MGQSCPKRAGAENLPDVAMQLNISRGVQGNKIKSLWLLAWHYNPVKTLSFRLNHNKPIKLHQQITGKLPQNLRSVAYLRKFDALVGAVTFGNIARAERNSLDAAVVDDVTDIAREWRSVELGTGARNSLRCV